MDFPWQDTCGVWIEIIYAFAKTYLEIPNSVKISQFPDMRTKLQQVLAKHIPSFFVVFWRACQKTVLTAAFKDHADTIHDIANQ